MESITLIDRVARQFCEGQIAYFKIPQHIRFVDEFPMTETGKIQIKEMEIKERGLAKLAKRETA
jgi:fatty-acyl-CoA synthase